MGKPIILPKTQYERKGNLYVCTHTNSTNNLNIYLADIIDLENIHFYEWAWIFPLLNMLQLILYVLEDKGKIHIFQPSVTFGQMQDGQFPNSEPQESSEEIQGILL